MPPKWKTRCSKVGELLHEKQEEQKEAWKAFAEDPSLPIPTNVDCDALHHLEVRMLETQSARMDDGTVSAATRNIIGMPTSSFGYNAAYNRSLRSTQTGIFHGCGVINTAKQAATLDLPTRTLRRRSMFDTSSPDPTSPEHVHAYHKAIGGGPIVEKRLAQIMHDENLEPGVRYLAAVDKWNITFCHQLPDTPLSTAAVSHLSTSDADEDEDMMPVVDGNDDEIREVNVEQASQGDKDEPDSDSSLRNMEDDREDRIGSGVSSHDEYMPDDERSSGGEDARDALGRTRRSTTNAASNTTPFLPNDSDADVSSDSSPSVPARQISTRRGRGNYVVVTTRGGGTKAMTREQWYESGYAKRIRFSD